MNNKTNLQGINSELQAIEKHLTRSKSQKEAPFRDFLRAERSKLLSQKRDLQVAELGNSGCAGKRTGNSDQFSNCLSRTAKTPGEKGQIQKLVTAGEKRTDSCFLADSNLNHSIKKTESLACAARVNDNNDLKKVHSEPAIPRRPGVGGVRVYYNSMFDTPQIYLNPFPDHLSTQTDEEEECVFKKHARHHSTLPKQNELVQAIGGVNSRNISYVLEVLSKR